MMTRTPEQIEALLAEARGMMDGITPGPWSVFVADDGGRWTGWPLSISADNIVDKTVVRTGGMWPYEWDAKTSQFEANANAAFIAASPTTLTALLEVVEQLRAENERMREALEPFVTNWADDYGWTKNACQNDRVVDWFGPSDFRLVLAALTDKEATHDNT